jgi:hypothetical protein
MSIFSLEALSQNPLAAISEITRGEAELEIVRYEMVKKARSSGASWERIAVALGTSKQAAWEYYALRFRDELEENTAKNAELTPDAALALSVEESRAVRRRRRSR